MKRCKTICTTDISDGLRSRKTLSSEERTEEFRAMVENILVDQSQNHLITQKERSRDRAAPAYSSRDGEGHGK